jgi:hypothetical protein
VEVQIALPFSKQAGSFASAKKLDIIFCHDLLLQSARQPLKISFSQWRVRDIPVREINVIHAFTRNDCFCGSSALVQMKILRIAFDCRLTVLSIRVLAFVPRFSETLCHL